MMASIRKRGHKYQVQVRRKGFPLETRSFHLYRDAQEWARHMDIKADRGELHASRRDLNQYTVKQIIERYIDEITIKKLSADTEAYILRAFLRNPISNLKLSEITTQHFSKYRTNRLKLVKPGTVNRELGIIQHAFDIAKSEWSIPIYNNPLRHLKKLKVKNARERRLAPKEYLLLLKAAKKCRNPYVTPIIKIALRTGMRRSEIINIKWAHINFKTHTLHIPHTKNGHSRNIPLCKRTIRLLKSLQDTSNDKVFQTTTNAFKLSWQRLVKRSSIQDLHFHDLRHEAISRFFELGLTVPEVALISGHKDYRMLFRYTHLKADHLADKLR